MMFMIPFQQLSDEFDVLGRACSPDGYSLLKLSLQETEQAACATQSGPSHAAQMVALPPFPCPGLVVSPARQFTKSNITKSRDTHCTLSDCPRPRPPNLLNRIYH
jgi:hypothetical protein